MANLITDLATALRDALRANTTLQTLLGVADGVTYHVEAADQPETYPAGAAGRAWIRFAGTETYETRDTSAETGFQFALAVELVDVRGTLAALNATGMALANVLRDWGSTIWDSYFTDNGSNRLGKSGTWRLVSLNIENLEALEDRDRPVVAAVIEARCWHQVPLA